MVLERLKGYGRRAVKVGKASTQNLSFGAGETPFRQKLKKFEPFKLKVGKKKAVKKKRKRKAKARTIVIKLK